MSLTKNIGPTDRKIRQAVAGILVLVGILISQPLLSLIGLIVVITTVIGFCPAYLPLKINTNKDQDEYR
jgi:hypothetical protein